MRSGQRTVEEEYQAKLNAFKEALFAISPSQEMSEEGKYVNVKVEGSYWKTLARIIYNISITVEPLRKKINSSYEYAIQDTSYWWKKIKNTAQDTKALREALNTTLKDAEVLKSFSENDANPHNDNILKKEVLAIFKAVREGLYFFLEENKNQFDPERVNFLLKPLLEVLPVNILVGFLSKERLAVEIIKAIVENINNIVPTLNKYLPEIDKKIEIFTQAKEAYSDSCGVVEQDSEDSKKEDWAAEDEEEYHDVLSDDEEECHDVFSDGEEEYQDVFPYDVESIIEEVKNLFKELEETIKLVKSQTFISSQMRDIQNKMDHINEWSKFLLGEQNEIDEKIKNKEKKLDNEEINQLKKKKEYLDGWIDNFSKLAKTILEDIPAVKKCIRTNSVKAISLKIDEYFTKREIEYRVRDFFDRIASTLLSCFGCKTEADKRMEYYADVKNKMNAYVLDGGKETKNALSGAIEIGITTFSPRTNNEKSKSYVNTFKATLEAVKAELPKKSYHKNYN